MSVAIKKLDGIDSVDVSLEKASAVLTLAADNKVTVPMLRRAIRSNGYPTRDALITARGRLVERDGKPMLDLLNGTTLELDAPSADAPADVVEVTGTSREREDKVERLTVTRVVRIVPRGGDVVDAGRIELPTSALRTQRSPS